MVQTPASTRGCGYVCERRALMNQISCVCGLAEASVCDKPTASTETTILQAKQGHSLVHHSQFQDQWWRNKAYSTVRLTGCAAAKATPVTRSLVAHSLLVDTSWQARVIGPQSTWQNPTLSSL